MSTQPDPPIGQRIRQERLKRGFNLRTLARAVNVSASHISQIETGKCRPSVSTLYAITSVLGVSIDDIFEASGPDLDSPASAASGQALAADAGLVSDAHLLASAGLVPDADLSDGAGLGANLGASADLGADADLVSAGHVGAEDAADGASPRVAGRPRASGNRLAGERAAAVGSEPAADAPGETGWPGDQRVIAPPTAGAAAALVALASEHARRVGPVIGPGQREILELDSGVTWERLGHVPGLHVDFLLITYAPGGSSSSTEQLMRHQGTEYGYLISGELVVTLGFAEHRIVAGDAICFPSSTPHRYRNEGPERAVGVWFVANPDAL